MCKWRNVFLSVLVACAGALQGLGAAAAPADAALPERANGTFVQKKTLADVDVTIVSTGTFRFEKGKFFEWKTLEPLPSTFLVTPTNYTLTVNGKKTTRRLKSDVDQIAKIFTIKEVKDFVKDVKAEPETGFPDTVTVDFRNGDRLLVEMTR